MTAYLRRPFINGAIHFVYGNSSMGNVQLSCFYLSYLVAFGLELARLLRRGTIHRGIMLVFGWAGLLAHTVYLVVRSRAVDLPPLLSSTRDWILVLAWLGVFVYLFLTTFDRDLAIGLFVLPVVLAFITVAVFASQTTNVLASDQVRYRWIMLHASLYVLGMAGVAFGLVLSLMYLFQHRRLKTTKRQIQSGLRLPSLATLTKMNWWAIVVSVPLLTCGLVSGVIVGQLFNTDTAVFKYSDPIVLLNIVVWVVMVIFFGWLMLTKRSSGKQVASLTIWACGFLLVTVIGSQLLSGGGVFNSFHSGVQGELQEGTSR